MVVWSNNASSLAVSETLTYFNVDELIEGSGTDQFQKETQNDSRTGGMV